MSYACPRCGAVSQNPTDEREGYCARCHDWTAGEEGEPELLREHFYRMGPLYYVLDEHNQPVPEPNMLAWAMWFEQNDSRTVANTEFHVAGRDEPVRVSTVFLGINTQLFDPTRKPNLFETMVFTGDEPGEQYRYPTWEEAERGHEQVVNLLKSRYIPGYTVAPEDLPPQNLGHLIIRLMSLIRPGGHVEERDRPAVRSIGEEINRIGGLTMMKAANLVVEHLGREPEDEDKPSEVALAWEGIGEWSP